MSDSNENTNKGIALYGDLTALYSYRTRCRRNINYEQLNAGILEYFEVDEFDEMRWFSLYDKGNAKQSEFIDMLENFGWKVETYNIRDIRRFGNSTNYRFDHHIAYELAASVEQYDRVVVVSDSYDLCPVLEKFSNEDKNADISLAFYIDGLDNRWLRHAPTDNNRDSFRLKFIDLAQFSG